MESPEFIHYTDDTVQITPRASESCKHGQTKTIFISSRRQFFNRKKNLRKFSKINDSTCTLIENDAVSQSLNNHNLRISLKTIYDTDPVTQLKQIFKAQHKSTPKKLSHEHQNFSFELPSRKRSKVDSLFHHNEADFIMNELKTIKSPVIWQQVVQNFKKKPSTLMDLIPINSFYPKARTPSTTIKSPSNRLGNLRKSESPKAIKKNQRGSVIKPTFQQPSPKITRCGSESPIEVQTFLQEDENETLTDDWGKSLLYQKIKNRENLDLAMTESEMKTLTRKPPREKEMIEFTMIKGLSVLRSLLMELLGTKEDMNRFEEKFKGTSNLYVRALMDRCLSLLKVRNLTIEVLKRIEKRETILKNLKVSRNKVKEKVLKVFCLSKEIRDKIAEWMREENVPFKKFVFKGKDYLKKVSEDSVELQEYLGKVVDVKVKK